VSGVGVKSRKKKDGGGGRLECLKEENCLSYLGLDTSTSTFFSNKTPWASFYGALFESENMHADAIS